MSLSLKSLLFVLISISSISSFNLDPGDFKILTPEEKSTKNSTCWFFGQNLKIDVGDDPSEKMLVIGAPRSSQPMNRSITQLNETTSSSTNHTYTDICGGDEISGESGYVSSSNYPADYANFSTCFITLSPPDGKEIHISFLEFQLEVANSCVYDMVIVFIGNTKYGRFCGKDIPANFTTARAVRILFASDHFVQDRGFLIEWKIMDGNDTDLVQKDSGDIIRCDIGDIFQSPATCRRITPTPKQEGDNFGLSLINSPFTQTMAVALNRLYECDRTSVIEPGILFRSENLHTWETFQSSKAECSSPMVDVMIVLDGSGSVELSNFQIMLKWTKSVAHGLMDSIGAKLRIGIIQFSHFHQIEMPLLHFENKDDLNVIVDAVLYGKGATEIGTAMNLAKRVFQEEKPNARAYQNIMILLTDGATDELLDPMANELLEFGIISFAIGVEPWDEATLTKYPDLPIVQRKQLTAIANNNTDRIFSVKNFDLLDNIVEQLKVQITSSLEGSATSGNTSRNYSMAQFGFSSSAIKKPTISSNQRVY